MNDDTTTTPAEDTAPGEETAVPQEAPATEVVETPIPDESPEVAPVPETQEHDGGVKPDFTRQSTV